MVSSALEQPGAVALSEGVRYASHSTVGVQRDVLVYARTGHTTQWSLDIVRAVLADRRIQVSFTIEDESPSASVDLTRALLSDVGALQVPWRTAIQREWDLVLASSPRGSYDRLCGPFVLTQHGPGFGKPQSIFGGGRLLVPRKPKGARADRANVTLVVSHPEQVELFGALPDGMEAVALGEPLLDRMLASRPLRESYRRRFGIGPGQRFVLVSSTWGPRSQFATDPMLWQRVAAALPLDAYRIGLIVHPNVWGGHGRWQIDTWLGQSGDAGVVVLSPGDDWKPAVVAADAIIADQGSVALYAAALGVPVLLGGFDHDELIATSVMGEIGRRSPTLDPDGDIAAQLDELVPTDNQWLLQRITNAPGSSLARHQEFFYRLLDLDLPAGPAPAARAVGAPSVRLRQDTPFFATIHRLAGNEGVRVHVERHPAALSVPPPPEKGRVCLQPGFSWPTTTPATSRFCSRPTRSSIGRPRVPRRRMRASKRRSGCSPAALWPAT